MARSSSKKGYGTHNVEKRKITDQDIRKILQKKWKDVDGMDLTKLYHSGWKTEVLATKFKTSISQLINKLRYL